MSESTTQKAVIYCRVSSAKQMKKGDGLNSQATRCREFAKYKGYTVEEVFNDDISGRLTERPGMQGMLQFVREHRADAYVIIVDDITRLARGMEAHFELRRTILAAGGKLESPSIEFGEDADSIMVENMLAAMSQHQSQKNAEQSKHRMRARTQNGYWVFSAPLGYRYIDTKGNGKILVRDEPVAAVLVEALEGYASGRFDTQAEVKRFLESHACIPRDKYGRVRNQRVKDILTRVVYAGYLESPKWDISLREAKHEALISFGTYQKIQERLKGNAKVPARKDLNQDFALRGFVNCGCCGTPLTSYWATGRSRRYPYYQCPRKGCRVYGKAIKRDELEQQFETLLAELKPSRHLFNLAIDLFRRWWEEQGHSAEAQATAMRSELTKIESKVGQFMERIVNNDSQTLIAAYEQQIIQLEKRKIEISESVKNCGRQLPDFDETFRTAFTFLGDPQKLWASERLEQRRLVLKMAFADRLQYVRDEGFRTAKVALPFKVLKAIQEGNKWPESTGGTGVEGLALQGEFSSSEGTLDPLQIQFVEMVRPGGLEPPTS